MSSSPEDREALVRQLRQAWHRARCQETDLDRAHSHKQPIGVLYGAITRMILLYLQTQNSKSLLTCVQSKLVVKISGVIQRKATVMNEHDRSMTLSALSTRRKTRDGRDWYDPATLGALRPREAWRRGE